MTSHDKQNGGQIFSLQARIAELWGFKARKVEKPHEENCLAIFKPEFFRCISAGTNGE